MEQNHYEKKPDSNIKTSCLNNFNSYLLCKGLAKDLYWDDSSCKELENNLLTYCKNNLYVKKCIYKQIIKDN
jgi:hypothetical protein